MPDFSLTLVGYCLAPGLGRSWVGFVASLCRGGGGGKRPKRLLHLSVVYCLTIDRALQSFVTVYTLLFGVQSGPNCGVDLFIYKGFLLPLFPALPLIKKVSGSKWAALGC